MDITIRPLRDEDRAQWDGLWRGYQRFYEIELAPEVSECTWRRLLAVDEPMHGLAAFDGERMLAIAHFLFHRSTWMIAETCYMQDLFVEPDARGRGIARRLVEAVYAAADTAGAGQVYWLTHHSNRSGRRLYDRVARTIGFILYERFAETPEED